MFKTAELSVFMDKRLIAGAFLLIVLVSLTLVIAKGPTNPNALENRNKNNNTLDLNETLNNTELNNTVLNDSDNNLNQTNSSVKKMTYGLCVANFTREKRGCYDEAKEKYRQCSYDIRMIKRGNINTTFLNFSQLNITLPTNRSEQRGFNNALREISKGCREVYKDESSVCKENFNQNKLSCVEYKCRANQIIVDGKCRNVRINNTEDQNSTDTNLTQVGSFVV